MTLETAADQVPGPREQVGRAFPTWRTCVSPDLSGSEYTAAPAIDALEGVVALERDGRLHLKTSMRSFRSEKVFSFVTALLDWPISTP